MPINQIGDDGAVIGYKPNLEYKKSLNGTVTQETTSSDSKDTNYSGEVQYSTTLSAFQSALPSGSLQAINASINLLNRLIDTLQSKYQQGEWGEFSDISAFVMALKNNSRDFADKFVAFHSQNINASIIPELILHLTEAQERLNTVGTTLKALYYGRDNITYEEAAEIDSAFTNQLKQLEAAQDLAKINYYALAMDATLNRTVSVYTYSVNKECMKMAEIVDKPDDLNASLSQAQLIQKLYDEVNADIQNRKSWYNTQQSLEIMQKTLYNYYVKRAETLDLYDLLNGNTEIPLVGRKLVERQKDVDNALLNVARIMNGHVYYSSEITKASKEKNSLMNIYSHLSYNTVDS